MEAAGNDMGHPKRGSGSTAGISRQSNSAFHSCFHKGHTCSTTLLNMSKLSYASLNIRLCIEDPDC